METQKIKEKIVDTKRPFLFSMSTKDLSYLLYGESSQERGSEWAGGGSDSPNNYQQDLT